MINFLVAENGDFLTAENGDFIILESGNNPPSGEFWCAMTGMSGLTGGGEIDGY
jgi:hypothetical protein